MDVDPHVAKLTVPATLLAARALWLRYALLVALRVVPGTAGALEIRAGAADGSRAVSRMGSGSAVPPGRPKRVGRLPLHGVRGGLAPPRPVSAACILAVQQQVVSALTSVPSASGVLAAPQRGDMYSDQYSNGV